MKHCELFIFIVVATSKWVESGVRSLSKDGAFRQGIQLLTRMLEEGDQGLASEV